MNKDLYVRNIGTALKLDVMSLQQARDKLLGILMKEYWNTINEKLASYSKDSIQYEIYSDKLKELIELNEIIKFENGE